MKKLSYDEQVQSNIDKLVRKRSKDKLKKLVKDHASELVKLLKM